MFSLKGLDDQDGGKIAKNSDFPEYFNFEVPLLAKNWKFSEFPHQSCG